MQIPVTLAVRRKCIGTDDPEDRQHRAGLVMQHAARAASRFASVVSGMESRSDDSRGASPGYLSVLYFNIR